MTPQVPPAIILDSGAGTGATAILQSGATDERGVVILTTGGDPTTNAGIFTLLFSKTRDLTMACLIPLNPEAKNLRIYGLMGTTARYFVPYSGWEGLKPQTTYIWLYHVGKACE